MCSELGAVSGTIADDGYSGCAATPIILLHAAVKQLLSCFFPLYNTKH